MNKKLFLRVLTLVGLMVLTLACDKTPDQNQENTSNKDSNQVQVTQNKNAQTEEADQETIKTQGSLFFPSKAYVQEGLAEPKYIQAPSSISYDSNKDNLAAAIIDLLEKGPYPSDDPDDPLKDATNFVPKGSILKVQVEDSIAVVDVSKSALAGGGDLDEELFIGQIVKSLSSFSEIDGVRFLVDGQEAESILGHYDISNGRVFQTVDWFKK